ncbi:MAG: tRNA-guanine transglycosylase, partial [Chloroflexota bacterium]
LNMKNTKYARDHRPVEEGCACYCCANFTRAYVRHLIVAKEILAATLLTIHNLHMLLTLMREMRAAIIEGTFDGYAQEFLAEWKKGRENSVNG